MIKAILEWNKKLFPVFVVIFLILVLINSLEFTTRYPKLFNLSYKLIFVLVSGVLIVVNYYLKRKQQMFYNQR